ncbi:hypothetical protein ACFLTR_00210 [Chloroflexota bacterium]
MDRDHRGKRIKVYNRIFMDAEYSFSMLKFYYGEVTDLLHNRADRFRKYTDELEEEHKKRDRPFDKKYWLKHYDVYSEYYPHIFNNSFIVSACALFELQIRKICTLVKEEHNVPVEWDDIKGSVPTRAKSYLWHGGILLTDDPPTIVLSPPNFVPTELPGQKRIIAKELWQEIESLFRVRNCVVHHNGLVQKLRYPTKLIEYASSKGILADSADQKELLLSRDFNKEVCDTMMKFFSKLTSTYYSTPLPE